MGKVKERLAKKGARRGKKGAAEEAPKKKSKDAEKKPRQKVGRLA